MYQQAIQQYLQQHGFGEFCPKAVLFDMDGVLYDSMPNHAHSWHTAMERYGLVMPPEDAYLYEGMRGVETIKLLCKEQWGRTVSDEESARMYARKSEIYASCPMAEVMPGVGQLMQQIYQMGMTIMVVTGSGQQTLLERLATDFVPYIQPQNIISAFDVQRGKPHPEPYLKGLERAGVQPWQAVVVENAPLGVRAAVAARIFTVAVNTGPLADEVLAREGASLVLPDMLEARSFFQSITI
ncbi:MAG: HAD family hydrolase [Prevotella sp.]